MCDCFDKVEANLKEKTGDPEASLKRKKMVHLIKWRVLYLLLILFARFAERNYQKKNNSNQFKKGADMREDIMYVIVYPDGLIVMNTQKYFKSFCIKEWCKGCSRTWKQWYKRGYRCKKVKVIFEIID